MASTTSHRMRCAHASRVQSRRSSTVCRAARSAKATVLDNTPCTLDNAVRKLKLGVHDPVDYMSGRHMSPKALEPRWLDLYKHPGQKVELTTDQGTPVPVAICSSPTEAQKTSGLGNYSIIDVVVEKETVPEHVFLAQADATFDISTIHGPGFSNPMNDDIKLENLLEEKRPILMVASGASGIATARSAICSSTVQAISTECPVIVIYIEQSKESAAFILEWDTWKENGIHLIPLYVPEAGASSDGAGSAPMLSKQDRVLLQLDGLFGKGGTIDELMGSQLPEAAVLFAGLCPQESKAVLRCLNKVDVPREQILQG